AYLMKAGSLHAREHLLRRRKLLHGGGKVFIRSAHAGKEGADSRKNFTEIEAIELPHEPTGFTEIKYSDLSLWLEHAEDLAQPGIIVGQIAETEGGNHQIHGAMRKGQLEGIALYGLNLLCCVFCHAVLQHLVGEIESIDRRTTSLLGSNGMKRDRHVSGTGAEI